MNEDYSDNVESGTQDIDQKVIDLFSFCSYFIVFFDCLQNRQNGNPQNKECDEEPFVPLRLKVYHDLLFVNRVAVKGENDTYAE